MTVPASKSLVYDDIWFNKNSTIPIEFTATDVDGEGVAIPFDLTNWEVRCIIGDDLIVKTSENQFEISIPDRTLGVGTVLLLPEDTNQMYDCIGYRIEVYNGNEVYPFVEGRLRQIHYY